MEKILLAVGYRQLEEYLEKELKKEYIFVGTTVYREGVLRAVGQKNPNIVILRETLEGSENIMTIVYEIRSMYPKTRIIFLAGKREPGDAFLAALVNYGVYDILYGGNIKASEVISLIRKPNQYADIKHLQPMPMLNEKNNEMIFQAPKIDAPDSNAVPALPVEIKQNISTNNTPQPEMQKVYAKDDTAKQKIITFIGSKHGVGNSTIALNASILLAQKGLKVLYLEINDKTPAISYWYELGYLEDGIDSALLGLNEGKYNKIDEAIVSMKEMKKKESQLQKNYKKFPDTLDFMFYSNKYLTKDEHVDLQEPIDLTNIKELYFYLIFQKGYDFVILDVPLDMSQEVSKSAILYSNRIFFTITQDVSSVGYALYQINELTKKGIKLDSKLYYVINKYEKASIKLEEIEDWVENKNIITVLNMNKECINANFVGLPVVLYSKNINIRNTLQTIEKLII